MSEKLKIGIDIDNVIADSYKSYIEEFNRKFKTTIKYAEISDFYYLEHSSGIERETVEFFINEILFSSDFQLSLSPYLEPQKIIEKWGRVGHSIHYITARPQEIAPVTKQWLKKHGFWVRGATLDLVGFDSHQRDPKFKKVITDKLGIDILIEDAKEIAEIMEIPVLLLDRPWNRGNLPINVKRVNNWQQIDDFVLQLVS